MADSFDLIRWQRNVRESLTTKDVYDIWDRACGFYEKKQISLSEWEEMSEIVHKRMGELTMTSVR